MIRRIIKILVMCVLFMGLLSLGGYTINSFKSEVHLRDPQEVMSPFFKSLPSFDPNKLVENLPEYEKEQNSIIDNNTSDGNNDNTSTTLPDFTTDPGLSDPGGPFSDGNNTEDPEITDPGSQVSEADITSDPGIDDQSTPTSATGNDSYTDEDGNIVKKDIKLPDTIEISYVRAIKIKLDDKEIELTSKNTAEFIRWLDSNWHADAEVSYEVDKAEETSEDSSTTENGSTQNGSVSSTGELVYDTILANEANLNALVSSINVIDKLPEYDDYDRTTYEKPVISYTLDGKKTNRNDYAWKTSPWYNAEDKTYMCPYTGTIIQDMDDNKQDNDFGNLDYDHIVPLKSTYLRGAKDWTDEQKNEYAYDQWVGVDVLNSANRSKSDKGPCDYLPDINVEDYCYSWLMICSKYNLSMTQEEIDICVSNITIALENGEEVTFLGGSYEIN